MTNLKYKLRWVAVLPGAILMGFLASVVLHLFLYFTLTNGSIISGFNTDKIEYLLYPFVMAIAFIFYGHNIAPNHKRKTAFALFGLYLTIWLFGSAIALFKGSIGPFYVNFSGRAILALIGAILGLCLAIKSKE